MEWRDISTAPEDGSQVLLFLRNGTIIICPASSRLKESEERRGSLEIYHATGDWPNAGWLPTHWMPIPPPPTPIEEKKP